MISRGVSGSLPTVRGREFDIACAEHLLGIRNLERLVKLFMPKVTVLPANVSADVPEGELLIEAGEKAGVEMEAGCFNCECGTCAAEIVSGMENLEAPTDGELDVLDQWSKDPAKFRLTCCVRIKSGEVVIRAGH